MDPMKDLESIFLAGVDRADPQKMITRALSLSGEVLRIETPGGTLEYSLAEFKKIVVLGAGKAAFPMTHALEEVLGERITRGRIVTKYGFSGRLRHVEILEAGHPIPDESSLRAAQEIGALADEADESTLVIVLISGGGSALLASPADFGDVPLTLADKQAATKLLLESGATINEINCIRKHCSGIKGGRLARRISPASFITLILSDVVGDNLNAIASGPTVGDSTTYEEALAIVRRYALEKRLPPAVLSLLKKGAAGEAEETPEPESPVFENGTNVLLGTNFASLEACREKALQLGYDTLVLSPRITGEAREAARFYYGLARGVQEYGLLGKKPFCLIAGGETTVTLKGEGKGGRNQEMALAFLEELRKEGEENRNLFFLAASTDGNDGPTDAAGAFASWEILSRSRQAGLSSARFLEENDSYTFFDKSGALLKTGATRTNVCDIQIFIVT